MTQKKQTKRTIKIYKFDDELNPIEIQINDPENSNLNKILKPYNKLKDFFGFASKQAHINKLNDRFGIPKSIRHLENLKRITTTPTIREFNAVGLNIINKQADLYKQIQDITATPHRNAKIIQDLSKKIKAIEKELQEFESNYFYSEYELLQKQNAEKDKQLQAEIKEKQALQKQLNEIQAELYKSFQSILNKTATAYQPEQPESNQKPKTLKPNFDDPTGQINVIFEHTKDLFISNLEQWKNLFSKDIQTFETPIILQSNTTLADLRLFIDLLYQKGLIKKRSFNKILQDVKAFEYQGNIIKASQLKFATKGNYPHTKNKYQILEVFKKLKTD